MANFTGDETYRCPDCGKQLKVFVGVTGVDADGVDRGAVMVCPDHGAFSTLKPGSTDPGDFVQVTPAQPDDLDG